MKLVWKRTGDFINCVAIDNELTEFWLEQHSNHIWGSSQLHKLSQMETLKNILIDLQTQGIDFIDPLVDIANNFNPVNQFELNKLHKTWVQMHQMNLIPADKLNDRSIKFSIDSINKILHDLESAWIVRVTSKTALFTESPRNIKPIFGKSNIILRYDLLGRSTYNKWEFFDNNVHSSDTNDYQQFSNQLLVNLNRTYTQEPPVEYVNWCKEMNCVPRPNELLIANFENLQENLTEYRTLFMKNFALIGNDVIFTK